MSTNKYPRTYHLPWSQGASSDDKISNDVSCFINNDILITEKLDGSNFCMTSENCYARSHNGPPTHKSFDLAKAYHAEVKCNIPNNIHLYMEYMYALHSIHYTELPGYFLLFNVRNVKDNTWASWEEVELWAEEISVPTVPVLFNGKLSSSEELKKITESFMKQPSCCGGIREGVVIRVSDEFAGDNFASYVQKMVRKNHVQTSTHWKEQEIVRNILRKV